MSNVSGAAAFRDAVHREVVETEARIESLERELTSIIESADSANIDDEHDPEGSTIAYERAMVIALLESSRTHLAELGVALDRVGPDGGLSCESCGRPIPDARLLAVPTATMCTDCADRSSHQP